MPPRLTRYFSSKIPFQSVNEDALAVPGTSQAHRQARRQARRQAPSNYSLDLIPSRRIVLYTEILRYRRRVEDEDEEGDVGVE